jgi:hypothetical protein
LRAGTWRGRPQAGKKDPQLETALLALFTPDTAGDPMSTWKWVRSRLRQLSQRLAHMSRAVSAPTVSRLLRTHDHALRVNAKEKEANSHHAARNTQFQHIAAQKHAFAAAGCPIISADTKKKAMIGNFKNARHVWCQQPIEVSVHDFPGEALGRAVPYGIYDLQHNQSAVNMGTSSDSPEFAVTAIAQWWETIGREAYPQARQLLILADAGGSHGYRYRLWKAQLHNQLSDSLGLSVTVCHYPTGCSKWNPIEHRSFRQISLNWAGKPLRTFETMLGYIRDTTTATGLEVTTSLVEGVYQTGKRVADAVMKTPCMEHHAVCPPWNPTIRPRADGGLVI